MGTTSEKLTYLNGTKQELKDKINNLGGSIDDNTTFRQYANQLQNVYDNLPKTEYQEGTEVNLGKTTKGKLDFDDGKVGFGQASQDSTQGYQLLNITATSGTKNGATWVVNEDKSITISTNGATTGLVTIPVVTSKTLEAGTYYMSGITGGTENTYFFGILVNNPTQWVARNYNGVTQFSVSEQKTYTQIWIVIATGTNLSTPITVYPMISKTNTSTYEPYTGGQASPNPSYPQEIKYVRGKNLFDGELELGEYDNDTGEKKTTAERYRNANYIKVSPNTIYTFSINGTSQKYVIYEYTSSKTFIQYLAPTTGTFTTSSTTRYINFRNYAADYTSDWANLKIQLEQGTQATPYLPYNTIEEVVSGKNKANLGTINKTEIGVVTTCTNQRIKYNGTTTVGGNLLPNGFDCYSLGIFKKGTYTASFRYIGGTYTEPSGVGNAFYFRVPSLGIVITTGAGHIISGWARTFTLTEDAEVFIQHYVSGAGMVLDNFEYSIQIEKGSSATTYEPYITPTSYQFSLGDHKFYGIPNTDYRDELVYDVDEDKVYKNEKIKKKSITDIIGSRTVTYNSTYSQFVIAQNPLPDLANNSDYASQSYTPTFLCNSYKASTFSNALTSTGYFVSYLYINAQDNRQLRFKNADTSDVDAFKTSVANDYLLYPVETPVETEITDTTLINQVKALYNAHSLNGTTIITSNGNLPMIIKCRGLKGE